MLETTTITIHPENNKVTLVRELMTRTGASKIGQQVMENMLRGLADEEDEEFIQKFLSLANPDQLVEMIVPLYVAHFDEETLKALIDFYKTPAGVKLVAAIPAITEGAMLAGQRWGTELAEQL